MIGQLVWRNLIHRPLRTGISILAVAVEVTLIIIIVGLTGGMLQETAKRIEGVGADIMVQPPSASVLLAFSGAPMPITIGNRLEKIPDVQAVAPILLQFNANGVEMVYGIEPESFRVVSNGFVFLAGKDMSGPDDMLVDDWAARSKNLKPGDTYRLLDHDFHVTGIVEHGKGARTFVNLATLQDLTGGREKASIFFVKCTNSDRTAAVIDEIQKVLPRYEIRPLKDYLSLMTSTTIPGLNAFVTSMITLAVAIGFLVIFLATYSTVIERTRDIGVLKSLGASPAYITRAFLSETALISASGILLGVAISYATRSFFVSALPTLSILITAPWIIRAALIAFAGGMIGASYPAWLANRRDVIEALAYE
jgi:putative ABC transport system permease protein